MILVCLGDSLTYGYGVPRPRVWPTLLGSMTGLDVRNAGINGDTTSGMLARFQTDVLAAQADAVCLMGGFNDLALGAGPGTVRANLFALVQQCFHARVRPILGVPIAVRHPLTFPLLRSVNMDQACAAYEDLHAWLRLLAADFGLSCLDFARYFAKHAAAAPDPAAALAALYSDGLHPSEAGHSLMAQEAARLLRA
ncbi:GDSL-type esterase/lipase family protein [Desulfovibrio legallii]|uniref:SGNH hydrolase-type esterase domain-containing protein n=1 Tax=Desulfovibrio legallii TaxID=571438 RepID=A0A6H3FC04_9BACT|nr:GDSL-type esterase/lipase family protein [Desulfovibrio legallii]RHH20857.1 hypothetical protein DW219_09365 [Desulfovibrio sp. AM18-2]TBH80599.1 hypothetical protein EB812_05565 [Desulfovibrio legallii]